MSWGPAGQTKQERGTQIWVPGDAKRFYCLGLFNTFCTAGRQLLKVAIAFLGHLSCKEMGLPNHK